MAMKPNMGRQKIRISKIEKKSNLQVTFSKRRFGLYKKAHELSTLCNVELALIVFSPAKKVFTFGTPNVDYVIDRYTNASASSARYRGNGAAVGELNSQLTQIESELEVAKRRGEFFDGMLRETASQNRLCWWREEYPHPVGLHELEQLKDSMEELKRLTTDQVGKLMVEAATVNSWPFFFQNTSNDHSFSTTMTPNVYGGY